MITTTWALEIVLLRIVADVDEYGATINQQIAREPVASYYNGGFMSEAGATGTYDACVAQCQAGQAFARLEPTGDPQ